MSIVASRLSLNQGYQQRHKDCQYICLMTQCLNGKFQSVFLVCLIDSVHKYRNIYSKCLNDRYLY